MTSDALSRLRAGLDRDEALARAIDDKQFDSGWGIVTYPGYPGYTIAPHIGHAHETEAAEHIVRQGPDRVLRQVAAIRRAIDEELENQRKFDAEFGCVHDVEDIAAGRCPAFNSPLLEALADIYPTETGEA